tara:strand:+ start:2096 stop:2806 length:711 start_codon:yes stop_codon:yes gene_type:complete
MTDNARIAVWWPLLGTLVLHAFVIALLVREWPTESLLVSVAPTQPKAIQARLVVAESINPKPKKTLIKKKKLIKKKPVKRIVEPKKKSKKAEIKIIEELQIIEEPIIEPTLNSALEKLEFSKAMEQEEMMFAVINDLEVAQNYVAIIAEAVQNSWSRPPSARNNMEVELIIQLIPTGEVGSVSIVKSSGQLAFDRSAINAVKKAGHFPALQQLPSRVFEKHFRRFRLIFRPEDLRL